MAEVDWLSVNGALMYWHISGNCRRVVSFIYDSQVDVSDIQAHNLIQTGPFLPIPLDNYIVAFNWSKIEGGSYYKYPHSYELSERRIELARTDQGKYEVRIGYDRYHWATISYVHELQWIFNTFNRDPESIIKLHFLEEGSEEKRLLNSCLSIFISPDELLNSCLSIFIRPNELYER